MPRLNDNVGGWYGKTPLAERNSIGVEIELEGGENSKNGFPVCDKYWNKYFDGSLRGYINAEYVLYHPLSKKELYEAVDYLKAVLLSAEIEILDSVRAGVHVHINVRDLTFVQLWTFVSCYYVVEELLTDWCGDGRQGNHFCLRVIDADHVLNELTRAITTGNINRLNNDRIRYSALNFNSLEKFGSLEFRQLKTPTDFSKIKIWASILLSIKESSFLFASPRSVVENFSHGGEESFLHTVLGEHFNLFMVTKETKFSMRRGVRLSQELAYSRKW